MQRFWVSWWSGYYEDEGCRKPPFQVWITGQRERAPIPGKDADRDSCSICAVFEAENEAAIWTIVARYFPDYEERFCSPVAADYTPNNRFPGFDDNQIGLGE